MTPTTAIHPPAAEVTAGPQGFKLDTSMVWYYLNIIRRRFWIILAVLAIAVTIGTIQAFRAVNIYRAKVNILVEKQVPRALKSDGLIQEAMYWDPDYYTTQADLVRSRAVLELAMERPEIIAMFKPSAAAADGAPSGQSVITELRRSALAMLGSTPLPPAEPWERLRGALRSQHLEDTHIIEVSVESSVPASAALIANVAAESFVDYTLRQKKDIYGDTMEYLKEEREREEAALARSEIALQDFRKNAKVVSLDAPESQQPAVTELANLNSTRTDKRLQRIQLAAEMAVIETIPLTNTPISSDAILRLLAVPAIRGDSAVSSAKQRLDEISKTIIQLRETYGPDHPRMIAARNDLEVLSQSLQQAVLQTVAALQNRVIALENEEKELNAQYEKQETLALDLTKELFVFSRLRNDVERHRRLYESLTDRLVEIDMSANYLRTNARIVEKASVPVAPIRPNRKRMVTAAAFLGLMLGSGLAFLAESLDSKVRTPEDLHNQTGLRVFGFVPHISLRDRLRTQKALDPAIDPIVFRGTFAIREQMSSISEAYRNLRTNLFYSFPTSDVRTLGITSCTPGEGKTTTASNLALAMAMADKLTLLIDGDLHRPAVHRIFGLNNDAGFTSILEGKAEPADVTQTVSLGEKHSGRLFVIPSGPEHHSPSELVTSNRTEEFFNWARKNFEWILVDMPPVLFVSDAGVLSVLSDGIIMVVRSGVNNRSMLLRARNHMEQLGTKIIGGILNDAQVSRLGRHYSDYYYHGYSNYSRNYPKTYRKGKK